jgi:hypothetical protein
MPARILALAMTLVIAISTQCWSQLKSLPSSPDKLVGFVSSPEPAGWLVIGPNNSDVQPQISEDCKSIVFEGSAGSYIAIAFTNKTLPDGKLIPVPIRQVVVLGGTTPVPPPVPPVPPVPPGSKWIMIIEETGDRSPQVGNLIISIRKQPELSKLVQILDKDAQAEYAKKIIKAIPAGYTLPAIVSVSSDGNPLRVGPFRATDTIDKIKEFLQ